MITVKSVGVDDIEDAMKIGLKFWSETPIYSKYEWDTKSSYSFLEDVALDNDDACMYLAYRDGKAIGLIIGEVIKFYFSKARFLQDMFIYVLPEERGSKAAYLLMNEYFKFGEEKEVDEVFFEVSAGIDNEKSISFLEKFGFKTMAHGMVLEN